MSKRVKIYKPKIEFSMKGKQRVRTITNKKHEFIKERAVTDRTLEQYQFNEFETIMQTGLYMEEVKKEVVKDESQKRTRRSKEQIESDNKTKN